MVLIGVWLWQVSTQWIHVIQCIDGHNKCLNVCDWPPAVISSQANQTHTVNTLQWLIQAVAPCKHGYGKDCRHFCANHCIGSSIRFGTANKDCERIPHISSWVICMLYQNFHDVSKCKLGIDALGRSAKDVYADWEQVPWKRNNYSKHNHATVSELCLVGAGHIHLHMIHNSYKDAVSRYVYF